MWKKVATSVCLASLLLGNGCKSSTTGPTTNPVLNVSTYDTVNAIIQGLEPIANALAVAGFLPQVDVTLAEDGINLAMTAWKNALASGTAVEQANAEAAVHAKIAALETLIARGNQTKAVKLTGITVK